MASLDQGSTEPLRFQVSSGEMAAKGEQEFRLPGCSVGGKISRRTASYGRISREEKGVHVKEMDRHDHRRKKKETCAMAASI